MLAMLPQKSTVRVSQVRISPPRLSIAPPKRAVSSARLPKSSSWRLSTSWAPSSLQIRRRRRLAADGDDPVAAAREHVDGEAADAAGGARDHDRPALWGLPVLLHAMDGEGGGEAGGAERHDVEGIQAGRAAG